MKLLKMDLDLIKTSVVAPPPTGGCMGGWVGSGQITKG